MRLFHYSTLVLAAALALLSGGCNITLPEHDSGPETAPGEFTALSPAALHDEKHAVSFQKQVKPILESKCVTCHSGEPVTAGYRLDSKSFAFAAGTAGSRILPGNPDQSLFLKFASTHKNVAGMPAVGNRLTPTESRILRRWIAEGASWPDGKEGLLKPSMSPLHRERNS